MIMCIRNDFLIRAEESSLISILHWDWTVC